MSKPIEWRRSTRCGSSGCVEVATEGERVHVRRSADPEGPRLVFDRAEWRTFVDGVKRGEFDR